MCSKQLFGGIFSHEILSKNNKKNLQKKDENVVVNCCLETLIRFWLVIMYRTRAKRYTYHCVNDRGWFWMRWFVFMFVLTFVFMFIQHNDWWECHTASLNCDYSPWHVTRFKRHAMAHPCWSRHRPATSLIDQMRERLVCLSTTGSSASRPRSGFLTNALHWLQRMRYTRVFSRVHSTFFSLLSMVFLLMLLVFCWCRWFFCWCCYLFL